MVQVLWYKRLIPSVLQSNYVEYSMKLKKKMSIIDMVIIFKKNIILLSQSAMFFHLTIIKCVDLISQDI